MNYKNLTIRRIKFNYHEIEVRLMHDHAQILEDCEDLRTFTLWSRALLRQNIRYAVTINNETIATRVSLTRAYF